MGVTPVAAAAMFRVRVIAGTSPLVLQVSGSIDATSAKPLMRHIVRECTRDQVLLDLSGVERFDAAGVSALTRLRHLLDERVVLGATSAAVERAIAACQAPYLPARRDETADAGR